MACVGSWNGSFTRRPLAADRCSPSAMQWEQRPAGSRSASLGGTAKNFHDLLDVHNARGSLPLRDLDSPPPLPRLNMGDFERDRMAATQEIDSAQQRITDHGNGRIERKAKRDRK